MSEFFDDLTRALAEPVSRRDALRLIGGTIAAAALSRLRPGSAQEVPNVCNDPTYPHECGDICCRYDYYCPSATLLNGSDTQGICCINEPVPYQLCSDGTHGWCCAPEATCGDQTWQCIEPPQCESGQEECGEACCDTAAGETCCSPFDDLCCPAGSVCCFDNLGNGTCCPENHLCVPHGTPGEPPGNVCCPQEQACRGQCCPGNEVCVGNLLCCPEERATGNRSGCCNPGFVWVGPGNECCLEGKACNGECCPGTQVCIGGECQECPDSQELCFDTCCEPGSCCFGKCCPPGTICTGECTTLETISEQILQSSGGTLTSSDDAFEITFPAFATQQDVTVTYSSQQAPSHPLPPNTQLLRSFTLQAETGGGQQVTQFQQAYTMEVAYTESTLAAMNLASESTLQLLWWDGSQWTNMLPCLMCGVDRTNEEVIVRADHFSEFALVAQQHKVHLPVIIDG